MPSDSSRCVIGWREWAALPDLGIDRLKVKIDTGARTSALHAYYVRPYRKRGIEWVQFGIHPKQRDTDHCIECVAKVKDKRIISDSGGHKDQRYVIETDIVLGGKRWTIDMSLTDRDSMRFRMLLGRTAMVERFVVDPAESYLMGKMK